MYRALYRKLLKLYPPALKARFGESMLQTFDDLCNERREISFGFMLWILADTAVGAARENL
jgi:hypothetical protein